MKVMEYRKLADVLDDVKKGIGSPKKGWELLLSYLKKNFKNICNFNKEGVNIYGKNMTLELIPRKSIVTVSLIANNGNKILGEEEIPIENIKIKKESGSLCVYNGFNNKQKCCLVLKSGDSINEEYEEDIDGKMVKVVRKEIFYGYRFSVQGEFYMVAGDKENSYIFLYKKGNYSELDSDGEVVLADNGFYKIISEESEVSDIVDSIMQDSGIDFSEDEIESLTGAIEDNIAYNV